MTARIRDPAEDTLGVEPGDDRAQHGAPSWSSMASEGLVQWEHLAGVGRGSARFVLIHTGSWFVVRDFCGGPQTWW